MTVQYDLTAMALQISYLNVLGRFQVICDNWFDTNNNVVIVHLDEGDIRTFKMSTKVLYYSNTICVVCQL